MASTPQPSTSAATRAARRRMEELTLKEEEVSEEVGGTGGEEPAGQDQDSQGPPEPSSGTAPKPPGPPTVKKPQSTSSRLQMQVLRDCIVRLIGEGEDVTEIANLLDDAVKDMDKEIVVVRKMKAIANRAVLFQHDMPLDGEFTGENMENSFKDEEEVVEGGSEYDSFLNPGPSILDQMENPE